MTPIVCSKLQSSVLKEYGPGYSMDRAIVVVDLTVWKLWQKHISSAFRSAYDRVEFRFIPGGESCKCTEELTQILQLFCDLEVDRRRDALFVIGGGTLLDLVGFAASIYRRGIAITKIPTSVMAQVDAAVGLKNAINFNDSKNIVGSFYPPHSVIIDSQFLGTLPQRHVANGIAEIVKIALVLDDALFRAIESLSLRHDDKASYESVYIRAIELMVSQLNQNPYEHALQRAVDFGHWLSPYLEMQDHNLLHGEAVSIDIANSLAISFRRNLISKEEMMRAITQLMRFALPVCHQSISVETSGKALRGTIKSRAGHQNIPLCTGIGRHAFFGDLTSDEVVGANIMLDQLRRKLRVHSLVKKNVA